MRNLIKYTLICAILFSTPVIAQNYELKLTNFDQISEFELMFDLEIRNISGTDWAYNSGYFAVDINPDLLNGGQFPTAYLTVDNSNSDLTAEQQLDNIDFFYSTVNTALQTNAKLTITDTPVMLLDDDQPRTIATFIVKLRNSDNSGYLNFGSVDPQFAFNLGITQVFECEYYMDNGVAKRGTAPGDFGASTLVPSVPEDYIMDVPDRQIAGYWFYGDGNWDVAENWNQTLKTEYPAYVQEVPGANANAIINGNVTIQDGLDVSLLPDGDGNGGEVTVLTGEAVLYTLTGTIVHTGAGGIVNIWSDGVGSTNLGNPVNLEAGTTVTLQAVDFNFPPNVSWTTDPANSGLFGNPNAYVTTFTMPANNVEAIATTSYKKLSIIENHSKGSKSLYASLTIVPGASLTTDKLFNDNANGAEAIMVLSDATGTGYLIHNNAGVLASIERYLSQTIYHFVSSPVVDAPYELLQTVNPQGTDDFFEWDESEMEWINLNYPYNNPPVGVLAPGKGYAVAYSLTEYTKVFEGEVNVGTISFDATYTPGPSPPYWNQKGQNLVGNPYPAALDAEMFVNANPTLFGLYFWDEDDNYTGNRDDYATWTTAGGVAGGKERYKPDGYIAPGQGFMAKVINTPVSAPATVTLNFENDMRTVTPTFFYKSSQERDRIWLSVTGPQDDYNEILVAFMEGADEGLDRSDAEKLKGNGKIAFYSLLEGGDFVIQGLPVLLPTDTYEIPLGLDAGITGQYTFNLEELENFDPNTDITFEDRLVGEIIDLKTTPQYTVHIDVPGDDPVIINDRFFLHFNGPTSVPVIGNQKHTKVFAVNNQIFIRHTGSNEILDVEVINALGQIVVRESVNAAEATVTVPGSNLVYIVKVRTTEGIESHKLLIR